MIDDAEINRRARTLRVLPEQVERDYILNHVLAAIAAGLPDLIFRGGTALTRIWWPDFRLSEDLDFLGRMTWEALADGLEEAVLDASDQCGRGLRLAMGPFRGGWVRATVRSDASELLVDVIMNERTFLPVEERQLNLPYSDLADMPRTIRVVALAEILGNKWFMLEDRDEPRDLFDLWAALVRQMVPFEEIARGHFARYGHNPILQTLDRAGRFAVMWRERLEHQMTDLPPFDVVLADVRRAFEGWSDSH